MIGVDDYMIQVEYKNRMIERYYNTGTKQEAQAKAHELKVSKGAIDSILFKVDYTVVPKQFF